MARWACPVALTLLSLLAIGASMQYSCPPHHPRTQSATHGLHPPVAQTQVHDLAARRGSLVARDDLSADALRETLEAYERTLNLAVEYSTACGAAEPVVVCSPLPCVAVIEVLEQRLPDCGAYRPSALACPIVYFTEVDAGSVAQVYCALQVEGGGAGDLDDDEWRRRAGEIRSVLASSSIADTASGPTFPE
jgi:hypothetical protein